MTTFTRRNFIKTLGAASIAAAGMSLGTGQAQRASAQTGSATGKIVITQTGGVRVHTYVGPPTVGNVTSHIIELENGLVMVDCQMLQSAAADLLGYIESLDKPLERVILSHAHPDHWLASNNYADTEFLSTANVAAAVEGAIAGGIVDQMAGSVGPDEVPDEPYAPTGSIEAGEETIDGVTFAYDIYENAEAEEQLVVRLPEAGIAIVQDFIYNNVHFFPLGTDIPNWIAILREMRGLADEGYTTILPGHGVPTTLGELDQAIAYLTFQQEVFSNATTAEDAITAFRVRYPAFDGLGLLSFIAMRYAPVDAEEEAMEEEAMEEEVTE